MKQPSRFARVILGLTHRRRIRAAVLGDFEEIYYEIYNQQGKKAARRWYWMQAIKSFPSFIHFSFYWSLIMFRNYLKVALRNLLKAKFYSLINICGLAAGLTVFLFITIYTRHELSFETFHENHESVYEVQVGEELSTCAPLGPAIRAQLPEVDAFVRIDEGYGGGRSPLLISGSDKSLRKNKVKNILFVEDNFFDLFSFPVLFGDPITALKEPYSMILTATLARQLFGDENAVGQRIHYVADRTNVPEMDMMVTAVVEDVPSNTNIRFNGLISMATLYTFEPNGSPIDEDWRNWGYRTYLQVNPESREQLEKKLIPLWKQASLTVWPDEEPSSIGLVALAETPFYNNNRRQFVLLIQMIGFFVLVIALINFINLTLARASSRATEVGIRKVVGSTRRELISQFLCESLLMSLIVTPLAILFIELAKPLFFSIIQQRITMNWFQQPELILILIMTVFTIGLISGLYPAVAMASFGASKILKGELNRGRKGNRLQFALVVLQFIISSALIFSTLVISRQIHFLRTKPLGFDQHNIIHCRQSKEIDDNYDVFKNRLLQYPSILSMTRSNTSLGQELNIGAALEINGVRNHYRSTTVDPDFVATMGIELIDGRDFSWNISGDEYGAMIVNETFVKTFDLKAPVGQQIKDFLGYFNPVIIGVMKDFHNDSFHEPVRPSALWYANWNGTINIRISGLDVSRSIQIIQQVWDEVSPNFPLEYHFLNQTYDNLYRSEDVLHRIFTAFASMAIFIACLGLLGLISYSARQRTKEIGIRKVMGSSAGNVVGLISKQYLVWVLIANAVALPTAAFAMGNWLNQFAYRTVLSPSPFFWACLSTLGIALITVGTQAIRAASTNPVNALRYE